MIRRKRFAPCLTILPVFFVASIAQATDQPMAQSPAQSRSGRILPEDLSREPFQFGKGFRVNAGSISDGGVLISGPLRYTYQARSTDSFFIKDSWGKLEFSAGMKFYGVPLGNKFGGGLRGIAWCFPDSTTKLIFASCVTAIEGKPITASTARHNPYLVQSVTANFAVVESSRTSLLQEESDHDLFAGHAAVEVRVGGWSNTRVEMITNVIAGGLVVSSIKQKVRLKNGGATIGFGTTIVRLRRAEEGGLVEVVSTVDTSADVLAKVLS